MGHLKTWGKSPKHERNIGKHEKTWVNMREDGGGNFSWTGGQSGAHVRPNHVWVCTWGVPGAMLDALPQAHARVGMLHVLLKTKTLDVMRRI